MTLRHTLAAIAALTAATAPAQEWIDTSTADNFMTLGARIGFNTSNATRDKEPALTNLDSWGTGFDAGVVVSLNFLNCVSVQPGFFFESRSHNYSYIAPSGSTVLPFNVHEYGHTRHTTFKVPVMGQFVTNPAEGLRWSFDFGPCFTFGLGGSDKGTYEIGGESRHYSDGYFDNRHKFDFSLKMGTGIQVLDHYYLGVHYEAGCTKVWKHSLAGRNKAWTFTIGYDF